MIVLDATIVNVALPSIKDDLHFSPNNLSWVVNAYLIAFGGLLLLAGRIGDLVGQRRVFLSGLTVFTVASLACGIAQDQVTLIAARFVQGVGGRSPRPSSSHIVTMFPEPRTWPRRSASTASWPRAAGRSACSRRCADLGDQLALDLLRQPAVGVATVLSRCASSEPGRHRPQAGGRRARRHADDRRAHARVYAILQSSAWVGSHFGRWDGRRRRRAHRRLVFGRAGSPIR